MFKFPPEQFRQAVPIGSSSISEDFESLVRYPFQVHGDSLCGIWRESITSRFREQGETCGALVEALIYVVVIA